MAFTSQWLDPRGAPTTTARDAITLLTRAMDDGLPPSRYHADELSRQADSLAVGPLGATDLPIRFDRGLTEAIVTYLSDLHQGRVDPRSLGFHFDVPRHQHDLGALLDSAVANHRLREMAKELWPPVIQYRRIREVLARYRDLARAPDEVLPPLEIRLRPGAAWPGVPALARRLTQLGDLPAHAVPDSSRYTGPLVAALRRFQERHGLDPDGVVGPATWTALNVPLAERVRQLELALERLRWLPDLPRGPLIVVNIATFRLLAWDSVPGDVQPSLTMKVIVGKSLDTQTPVFSRELRRLIFRPWWNVPRTIVEKEILPAANRDPRYLERNGLEIVQGAEDRATVLPATPATLSRLARGGLRVRQRPGPSNSLGLLKFIFPNDEAVYLHATPAQELFSQARRDFSHGCVRVERPVDLAVFALRGLPGWSRDSVLAAMHGADAYRVDLPEPIPVILFYATATVLPDGTAQFFPDIYGHDARLLAALGR